MEKKCLSSIERELVVQYLVDGNVPVTLTPVVDSSEKNNDEVRSLTSAIFPVALKPENIKTDINGFIFLENPPQSVMGFNLKNVKVEFYFNRVGLYFTTTVKNNKNGLYFSIPQSIYRIQEFIEEKKYDFTALLYFDFNSKKDVEYECIPWKYEAIFSRPTWKSIPLENQKNAKEYLEKFVEQAKIEKNAGNGIQLIPICNFLTMNSSPEIKSVKDRNEPYNILYVDHERIVVGFSEKNSMLHQNQEFGVKLSFSIKNSPIVSRDVFVTGMVNKVYENLEKSRICADICFTTIQEEDKRFLYEKATKTLFI